MRVHRPPYNTGSAFTHYDDGVEHSIWLSLGQLGDQPDLHGAMLAEALCKLEGLPYAPSDAIYWQHGHSAERDFVYITTASLTREQLQELADEVGPERSLLVLSPSSGAGATTPVSRSRRSPAKSSPAAHGAMTTTASR